MPATEITDARIARLREMYLMGTPGPMSSVDGTIFCENIEPERGQGVFILYDRAGYSGPECKKAADGKLFAELHNAGIPRLDEIELLRRDRDKYAEKLARESIRIARTDAFSDCSVFGVNKAIAEAKRHIAEGGGA